MKRREFTQGQRESIRERATDKDGTVRCEGCGLALKPGGWEYDHTLAEGLRPARKLTVEAGRLLGKKCCHRPKTADDVKKIAKAKRQSAAKYGKPAPAKPIQSKGFAPAPVKPTKPSHLDHLPRHSLFKKKEAP